VAADAFAAGSDWAGAITSLSSLWYLHPPEEAASVGRGTARRTTSFFAVLSISAQQRSPLQCYDAVVCRQQ
jgi:hypothetical protein